MRATYVHRPGHPKANDCGMVNVADLGADDEPSAAPPSGTTLMADRWREGSRATDGTDIGSRAKEREYMQRNGLAHAADFINHWEKAQQAKEAYITASGPTSRELKETIGRAAYELSTRRRK